MDWVSVGILGAFFSSVLWCVAGDRGSPYGGFRTFPAGVKERMQENAVEDERLEQF